MPGAERIQNPAPETVTRSHGGAHETRSARARWGNREELFADGFLVVPNIFLRRYASLRPPLTHGEALFVLHLLSFKWDEALPYPTYKTIAALMGVEEKTAQRYAQSLCKKKYLFRVFQDHGPNKFDLSPLFAALSAGARRDESADASEDGERIDLETAKRMFL